jgi:hypothetical protein
MLCSFPPNSIRTNRFKGRNKLWLDEPDLRGLFASNSDFAHILCDQIKDPLSSDSFGVFDIRNPVSCNFKIKVIIDTYFIPRLSIDF